MRVSRETAKKNRQRVVRTASEQFRSNGYDGIGVASLMKAAGMTQGGFYKQFESKEALELEATKLALDENHRVWGKSIEGADDPVAALRDWYLSAQHLHAVDKGCTYATLGAEATRARPAMQDVFSAAAERQISDLAAAIGEDPGNRAVAIQTIAQLIGTLILARSVSDKDLQQEIIDAGRQAPTKR